MVAFAVLVATLLPSLLFGVFYGIAHGRQSGVEPDALLRFSEDFRKTPIGLCTLVLSSQITFLTVAVVAAWAMGRGWRQRLRLRRPQGRSWEWCVAIVATLAVGFVPSMIFGWLFPDSGDHLKETESWMRSFEGLGAVLLLILLSVSPGICEEFLFRGFLLGAIEKQLPLAAAVLITAACFAAAHISPVHALLVFPIGIWLTLIAVTYDSLFPAMIAHAIYNFISVSISLGKDRLPMEMLGWMVLAMLAVTIPLFLLSAAMIATRLQRRRPPVAPNRML